MSDIKKLKKLGEKKTVYLTDKPRPELLEWFNNDHVENNYLIPFVMPFPEFTSLCPKTGQPDFAKIEIAYVPSIKMVESKSLKLYLFSFRNSGEFHEDVCNRIADDLDNLLEPRYLRVYGDFAPRGGLAIKPLVERWSLFVPRDKEQIKDIREMVNSFDIKSK